METSAQNHKFSQIEIVIQDVDDEFVVKYEDSKCLLLVVDYSLLKRKVSEHVDFLIDELNKLESIKNPEEHVKFQFLSYKDSLSIFSNFKRLLFINPRSSFPSFINFFWHDISDPVWSESFGIHHVLYWNENVNLKNL